VTHYWADRRTTLATLAERLRLGGFYGLAAPRPVRVLVVDEHGHDAHDADGRPVTVPVDAPSLGTGAYALDRSWHYAWLCVAAMVTALALPTRPSRRQQSPRPVGSTGRGLSRVRGQVDSRPTRLPRPHLDGSAGST